MLRDKGITVTEDMDGPLRPGSVVFVADARRRHPSRLRHAGLDRTSGQGSAGQDGGNAGADAGGKRALTREPLVRDPPGSRPISESWQCSVGRAIFMRAGTCSPRVTAL